MSSTRSSVTPAEAAIQLLLRRSARKTLEAFSEYTTPGWKAARIHKEICAALDAVLRGEVDRLLISCPPQHGKSTAASKRFPAFALGHDPTIDIISCSATQQLAGEFGRDTRNCVDSHEYRVLFPGATLSEDSHARGRWNTAQGGGYYAIGVGGALMGRGARLGLIDDPYATWEDGQSQRVRDHIWDWYTGTFYNRIRPGGAIVVIHHRMAEDDLIGRLVEQMKAGGPDRWRIVEIPADLENPPWPERYDRAALERLKGVSGPRKWSALFMQKPTPAEGTYFKREWFRRYTPEMLPKAMHHYLTSDHAPAGGESSDYNCFRMWGLNGADLYLVDGFRKQETMDLAMDRVIGVKAKAQRGLIQRWSPLAWFPEDDNNWKSVAGFVQRQMRAELVFARIEPITPNGADKEIKAMAFQAMASSGCVWIPVGPEGDEIIEQYVAFPGGKNDDEVDAAAVIGRAIDEAHPAISQAPPPPAKSGNDYQKAEEEDSWKAA